MYFKGTLSCLKNFWQLKALLKNAFYFTSRALFVLKIFKSLSWLFVHAARRFFEKDKVNFKFYDVTAWSADHCNTHIPQYDSFWNLDLDCAPGSWTQTHKNLEHENSGLWKTWSLKNVGNSWMQKKDWKTT